jgi:hypothetical protein
VKRQEPHEQWAARQVEGLPFRWRKRLVRSWEEARADVRANDQQGDALRRAGAGLLRALERLSAAPLPLDASDARVCEEAAKHADACRRTAEASQHLSIGARRSELESFCLTLGIVAPHESVDDVPAIARMVCPLWWRRQLRKAQARAVEGSAIALGYVNKRGDCYVSNESVEHRSEQNARNRAMLESTIARNVDTEQEFTLAELAAKSTADKSVRRAELMTRINGFERVAIDLKHDGAFFTLSCPSEMHAYRTASGNKVVRNRRYRDIRPNEGQAHLSGVWARIRAALARRGVKLYGFRIAEPNHDGTPHWHCLMFAAPQWPGAAKRAAMPRINAIVRRYSLEIPGDDAPDVRDLFEQEYERLKLTPYRFKKTKVLIARQIAERRQHELAIAHRARQNAQPGAKQHRVDWKKMDPAKGTAAGYIAKYVAKNIDGYRLEKDLYGNDSIEASQRVEAWASRWRIRQFQQVGGPPVTVWRELRRVESVPADAPAHVVKAHNAVNRVAVFEGRDNASVAWNHYVEAQGGVFCGRKYRVRLATVQPEGQTRYGEERAPQIVGIEYAGLVRPVIERDGIVIADIPRVRTVTVESKRFTWEILRPATSAISESRSFSRGARGTSAAAGGHSIRSGVKGLDLGLKRENRAPWTRVNNCTEGEKNGIENRDLLRRHGESGHRGRGDEAETGCREGAARGQRPLSDGQGDGRAATRDSHADSRRH